MPDFVSRICRANPRDSSFQTGVFSNHALIGSIALTLGLQLGVVYWQPLQNVFKTTALSPGELLACLALSTVVFWAVEIQKLFFRWRETPQRVRWEEKRSAVSVNMGQYVPPADDRSD